MRYCPLFPDAIDAARDEADDAADEAESAARQLSIFSESLPRRVYEPVVGPRMSEETVGDVNDSHVR